MRIQSDRSVLDAADLVKILAAHDSDIRRKIRLKNYYRGRHGIVEKAGRQNTDVNNRLVSNFPAYITNMSVGYFIGTPVTYKAISGEGQLAALLDIFRYNDEQQHNFELAEEASITGEAFEFLYLDADANIRLASVPSEEVILVCDATLEANVTFAIRRYRVYELDMINYEERVDVYDTREVRHYLYRGGALKQTGVDAHYFDDVPVVDFPNNRQRRGDFEDVTSLVDAYNLAQSLTMDDLADFTDAFLILKGVGGLTPEDAKALRRDKILILEEGGGAEWLIKKLNDTYVENIKRRLQEDIHRFSGVPNMSDENFASNASGVAIRYKLIALEQNRSKKEREFKKAIQRRIELIAGVLRLKNEASIDFRDIVIQFSSNIPQNLQETAQVATQLDGLVSRKTLLGLLPFIEDAGEELANLRVERGDE